MRVTEFIKAMPVDTRPAEYQRADRDSRRSRSLSETKASYRESQATSQSKARMNRRRTSLGAEGETQEKRLRAKNVRALSVGTCQDSLGQVKIPFVLEGPC